ncbi:lamin tail domain-containing protein, partial [Candidatus Poribacteria bacterium]|nr:lamin tail domain-containing protein [Candidatus Poribacteria bacterium]
MKNFVLSFLLVATFVFVAVPVKAIVEITVDGEHTAGTSPPTDSTTIITLTYNVTPDPKPTVEDFVLLNPSTDVTFSEGDDNNPKTYQITWTNVDATTSIDFTLAGYQNFIVSNIIDGTTLEFSGRSLTHATNYLAGLGYAIIAGNNTALAAGVYPTLPALRAPDTINKVAWSSVSSEALMPDIYTLFADGGTLNLRVNVPGTTNRLGSQLEDDSYDEDTNRNQRQVVINEVMWAYDENFRGTTDNLFREQWIELYNRGTTPIAFSDIRLTTSKQDPGPPAETDRLSNIPSYTITWDILERGQHGSSGNPRREFKSMQRINYDDGWHKEHWNTATSQYLRNYFGTPGRENRTTRVRAPRTPPNRDTPPINKIIINEIGNLSDDTLDWIELRNVAGSSQSLENWVLTITHGFDTETEIIRFPNKSIPARGLLLLVNRDPQFTPFAAGQDITLDDDSQVYGAGPHQYLIVDDSNVDGDELAIPDNDRWLLILRSNKPWDVGDGRDVYKTGFRVEDVAGPGALHAAFKEETLDSPEPTYEKKSDGKPDGEIWHTKVFPLNGNTQADADFLQGDRLNEAGKVWVRDGAKQGYLKDAWTKVGFTGIGYDRSVRANDQNSGTPGYANDVAKGKIAQLDGGNLIINELMLTTSNNRLPQWIELYNTSKTRGIDLAADTSDPKTGWQLIIENYDSGSWKENKRNLNITVNLKDLFTYIPPNQTVLIVSSEGRPSDRNHFPDTRVASIFRDLPNKFSMATRKDPILNAEGGFYIRIVDGDGTVSDEVGNLDGNPPNPRQGIGIDDPYSWDWSTALTEEGARTSLIRLRDANGRPRIALPNRNVEGDMTGAVLPLGMKRERPPKYAWVHAVDTEFRRVPKTWYGESKDISTPGFVRGIQLPVSLSF